MNSKKYAPVIIRLGLAIVFLWFGFSQLFDQTMWLSLIPSSLVIATGISAKTFVILNGIFEVVMASMLALGIRIRIVAALLFLHLIVIIGDVGINPIGVRDVGLTLGLLAIVFHGPDSHSHDTEKIS